MRHAVRVAILLLVCAWATTAPIAQTLYKSVGPDGKVVYGDRPPAEGRIEKTMKFESLPSSALPASASSYVEQLRTSLSRLAPLLVPVLVNLPEPPTLRLPEPPTLQLEPNRALLWRRPAVRTATGRR